MLTIEVLNQFGANPKEGLERCMGNEALYFRLVNMALEDKGFNTLAEAIERDDKKAAFEAAHALKGSLGNLALTPLYELTSEITELLRANKEADYKTLADQLLAKRDALIASI